MLQRIKQHSKRYRHHYAIGTLAIIFVLSAFLYINFGCGENPTGAGTTPSTNPSAGTIYGVVVDTAGGGVKGATVSVGSNTATTTNEGYFSLSDVTPGNNIQINISKSGYVSTQSIIKLLAGNTVYMIAFLKEVGSETAFSGSTGGTAADGTASITIHENTLVYPNGAAVTGTVTVSVTSFDLTVTPEFGSFPGNFAGRTRPTGTDSPFAAYAYINISVVDQSGNPVNLKSGTTAEVHIPIPAAFQSPAPPDPIELWSYNESGGYWLHIGIATLEAGGTSYVAVLSHFSGYCLAPGNWNGGSLSGIVVDTLGMPVASAYIFAKSSHFESSGITGSNGRFSQLWTEANCRKEVWAQKGEKSSIKVIVDPDPTTPGTEYEIPSPITIESTNPASITLSWRTSPTFHLYGHFTGPISGESSRFHVTTLETSPAGSDATMESIGNPEIINISKFHPGTYRFSCENNTHSVGGTIEGEGPLINMNASLATVEFTVSGVSHTFNVPTSNPSNKDVWEVFEVAVNASGFITGITELAAYEKIGVDPNPYLYP